MCFNFLAICSILIWFNDAIVASSSLVYKLKLKHHTATATIKTTKKMLTGTTDKSTIFFFRFLRIETLFMGIWTAVVAVNIYESGIWFRIKLEIVRCKCEYVRCIWAMCATQTLSHMSKSNGVNERGWQRANSALAQLIKWIIFFPTLICFGPFYRFPFKCVSFAYVCSFFVRLAATAITAAAAVSDAVDVFAVFCYCCCNAIFNWPDTRFYDLINDRCKFLWMPNSVLFVQAWFLFVQQHFYAQMELLVISPFEWYPPINWRWLWYWEPSIQHQMTSVSLSPVKIIIIAYLARFFPVELIRI